MATSNYVMPTYPKFPGYEETEKKTVKMVHKTRTEINARRERNGCGGQKNSPKNAN